MAGTLLAPADVRRFARPHGYLKDTNWVENTADSQAWAKSNLDSVLAKKAKYIGEWEAKQDKPILHDGDGQ